METYNIGPKNWAVVNSDVAEYDEEQIVNQGEPLQPGEQLEEKERPEKEEEEEQDLDDEDFEPQQDEREDLIAP